ncbi:terminase large subunit [Liquorilactobacillus uvarum]|uniref:terminase large subunit n=1 Tax=Liquorilactobacillus uvarum TaxID=303240 RepID=UPI00288BCC54|nr:terminase TerL endonuclease subunit [Liquorilactobacillus uvarum]
MMKFNRSKYIKVISKYNDSAMNYCLDVLENRLLACKNIKLACLRHIKDLQKIGTNGFHYDYSMSKAEGMLNFAAIIPDVSADKCLPLAQFQKFIYSMIEGWKDTKTNGARFKTVYLSMARTNGKTQIASALALRDFLLGMPVSSRQIVEASNTNEQIKQLYNYTRKAWHALVKTKWFAHWKSLVIDNSQEMRIESSNTFLKKFSSEGTTGDSVHASTTIFDEYHLQKSTDYLDSFSSGNVQNPLAKVIIISTAGTDPRVPMREDYSAYSEAIEKSTLSDEVLFLCWEQDKDDEAFQPETWIKSNPLMEVPVMKVKLTAGIKTERDKQVAAGNLPRFLVMNMNRWQNAKKNSYIELSSIEKAIIPEFDMCNIPCYVGFDASLSNDDTSLFFVFPYKDNLNNNKFFIYQHSWIPTKQAGGIEAKSKTDAINYQQAETEGFATISSNRFGTIDQDQVYNWMMEFIEEYNLQVMAFGYDQWNTSLFVRMLEGQFKDKVPCLAIRQGAKSLSEPTKFVQDNFYEGNIKMLDDRVLKAGLSNAVLTSKDNQILIDKNTRSAKIDMVDALIDAMYQGMLHFTDFSNVDSEEDKNNPFSGMSQEDINSYYLNHSVI